MQRETRLELGVARISQPATRERSALIVGGLHHYSNATLAALLGGNITWARDSVAAAQLIGALAWRPSARSRWQLEGGASGAAFALSELGNDGNGSGWLRARRTLSARYGVLAGLALGNTVRGATTSQSMSADVGAWATFGEVTFDVGAGRARTQDSLLMAASRVFTARRAGWLDVDDVAVSMSWAHGPIEATATQRWRSGIRGTIAEQAALQAAVTWTMTPTFSVVVAGGRQLADPVRGGPDATTMTALFRLGFHSTDTVGRAGESEVQVEPAIEGSILRVRIRAPVSARVEVAGSFSGWDPIQLSRKNGYWEAEIRVPSGRHRVAYRIDGGPWRAPTQLAKLREFGGEVGLLIIP